MHVLDNGEDDSKPYDTCVGNKQQALVETVVKTTKKCTILWKYSTVQFECCLLERYMLIVVYLNLYLCARQILTIIYNN